MKALELSTAIMLWYGSTQDHTLGQTVYAVWFFAFVLTWHGWSLLFAALFLLDTVSFVYMDSLSDSYLQATVLPGLFYLISAHLFVLLLFKLARMGTVRVDDDY